jgi:aspartokinase
MQTIDERDAALMREGKLEGAIQSLLNKVNVVTAHHRHSSTVSSEMLDDLSNRQIEVEQLLSENKALREGEK